MNLRPRKLVMVFDGLWSHSSSQSCSPN